MPPVEIAIATEPFGGLLAPPAPPGRAERLDADSLHDLALDQVLADLRVGVDADLIGETFLQPLRDVDGVRYRQEVFAALEHPSVRQVVVGFVDALRLVGGGEREARASRYPLQRARLHLTAVLGYCTAVERLTRDLLPALQATGVPSRGLAGLAEHARQVQRSRGFGRLRQRAHELDAAWDAAEFVLLTRAGTLTVAPFDDEPSLVDEVEATFERFRRGATVDHHSRLGDDQSLDHVQGWALEAAGALHRERMEPLLVWAEQTATFVDALLDQAARDTAFYLAYLDLARPLRESGLRFCYPDVSVERGGMRAEGTFDLALAAALVRAGKPVVLNDLSLAEDERILVVTGPNQGGKTTTARVFGQLHHLAALGCPVPGAAAAVVLPDRVRTCFSREERLETLEGRMGEEVQRIKAVLGAATAHSVVVLNEIFASTALQDAVLVNTEVLIRLLDLGSSGVCVTFIDGLTRLDDRIVSMVSRVDPDDPAVRTFKVERRRADGRAYAYALAEKHGLTYDQLVAGIGGGGAGR